MVLKRNLSLLEDYTGLGAARLSSVYTQEKQGITKEQFYRFSNTPLQIVTAMMQLMTCHSTAEDSSQRETQLRAVSHHPSPLLRE